MARAFEHDEFFLARVTMRGNDAAGPHAHQARVRTGGLVTAQLANFYKRCNLDPLALVDAQRVSPLGRLLARLFQNATAQSLTLLDTQLRGPQAVSERVLQTPRTAAHRASSASRSCASARRTWLLTVPSGRLVASAIS